MSRARLLGAGVLLGLLHAAATWLVPADASGWRTWGVEALRYLPWGWAAGSYAVYLAALVWATGPAAERLGPRWAPQAVAVALVLLFILLRARYGFLGDNFLRVREVEMGTGSPNEAGVMAVFRAVRRLTPTARAAVALVSFASGWIAAGVALAMARRWAEPPAGAWLVLGLLLGGTAEMFAAYLETYPLVLAMLLLSVGLSWAAARGEIPRWFPLLAAGAAVLLHRVAILWVPAALAPLVLSRPLAPRASLAVALACVSAPALAYGALVGRTPLLIPPPGAAGQYTLLSAAHLSDGLNAALLGSAAGALLLVPALARAVRSGFEPQVTVLVLASLLPGAALFFFRPLLGGLDWDLLALAAPFGFLLVAEVMGAGSRLLRVLILFGCLNTLPWLLTQATDAAIPRIRDLIRTERADYFVTHPPALHLAFLFGANGLSSLQDEELRRGAEAHPDDPRFAYTLADLARARSDWTEAERWALAAYRARRGYILPLDLLYDVYRETGRTEDQLMVGRALLEAYAADPEGVTRSVPRPRIDRIRREVETPPHP